MNRPLSTISIPAEALTTLQTNGFYYCEDIINRRGLVPEAQGILNQWNIGDLNYWRALMASPVTNNALDVSQDESSRAAIVTWSKEVDTLLGGGVPLGSVTELCGAPGSGKTQMCLQLCVNVQIPECFGGVGGEAIFIDTACGFSPQRLRDLAEACCYHCKILSKKLKQQRLKDQMNSFNSDKILQSVHFVSTHSISQLLAAVKLLPQVLAKQPKVQLIIIDSLAFPFNAGDSCSTIDRTSYLYRIFADLQKMCVEKNLAVVVTNQLTTHVSLSPTEKISKLAPALGESMGHRVNQRLLLGKTSRNMATAVLLKGINCYKPPSFIAQFRITADGIRS